jgi:ABC-type nitrate/sulfonate/bicarbonate transport system substrate-binding protein
MMSAIPHLPLLTRVAATLLAGLALLAACAAPRGESSAPAAGRAAAEPGAAAAAPARVALKTAYTTASATMSPIWLAMEAGGFAEQGLDAELTLVGPGQAILGALTSEETPIVMAGANQVLEANLQGGQYVILGSAVPYMTTSIFAVPAVQRPEDLRGLAVGVSNFGATTHVALKVALEHWGLEEGRDVTVVRSGGTPETIAAMQSGAIAGGAFGAPQSFLAHDLGFRELIDVATLRFELGSAAVISTRRYAAEHPDLVERYLKALMLGVQAYRTRKDLAVDAIMRYGRIDDRPSAERTWEYFVDKFSADLAMSPRAVENNLRMMADTQPGALSASPEQFLDGSFVERIRASGYVEQIARGQ